MLKRTVQLILSVTYGYEDRPGFIPPLKACTSALEQLVIDAASDGRLSGGNDFVVDHYDWTVQEPPVIHRPLTPEEAAVMERASDPNTEFGKLKGHIPQGEA